MTPAKTKDAFSDRKAPVEAIYLDGINCAAMYNLVYDKPRICCCNLTAGFKRGTDCIELSPFKEQSEESFLLEVESIVSDLESLGFLPVVIATYGGYSGYTVALDFINQQTNEERLANYLAS